MLKLKIYKFLGKFILYFKSKYMALCKDSILNAINQHIIGYLKSYQNNNLFNIGVGIIVDSDMNYHKIQYDILYNNSFKFNIFLEYKNGSIDKKITITEVSDGVDDIMDFFNYYKSDAYDLTEIILKLNDTI